MIDNEIIKALECCIKSSHFGECFENKCPLVSEKGCMVGKETLYPYALDLIKRQKAEIERLKGWQDLLKAEKHSLIKAEAVKEFAKKVDDMLWQIKIKYIHDGRPEFGNACEIAHIRLEKLFKETVGE
jgi:hypothetical protein